MATDTFYFMVAALSIRLSINPQDVCVNCDILYYYTQIDY